MFPCRAGIVRLMVCARWRAVEEFGCVRGRAGAQCFGVEPVLPGRRDHRHPGSLPDPCFRRGIGRAAAAGEDRFDRFALTGTFME